MTEQTTQAITVTDPSASTLWTGPSVRDMIASHTLAENIISRHGDSCLVLGPSELVLFHRFVHNPASHNQILRDFNMISDGTSLNFESTSSARQSIGAGALKHGSLAGYVVSRHSPDASDDPGPALTIEEIQKLKQWFNSGAADERMEGFVETGRGRFDVEKRGWVAE